MYQRRRALALCAGAVLAWGLSACADPATVNGAAAKISASATTATATGTGSSVPADTAAASSSQAEQTGPGVSDPAASTASSTTDADSSAVVTDTTTDTADGGDVTVQISYADWDSGASVVEAAASVSGVVEDGGTCTLTLTKGAKTAVASTTAVADAATTACGGLQIPATQLTSGSWSAVISYRSDTSSGKSAATTVVVP